MLATSHLSRVFFWTFAAFYLAYASSYSLTDKDCRDAIRNIGETLKIGLTKDPVVKATWVSPRCETRRTQAPDGRGETTSFLLRGFEIAGRRRWAANYFFYQDKDCREPTYGLQLQGQLTTKARDITFNFSNVKIGTYRSDFDKTFRESFNRSCPGGSMKPTEMSKDRNIQVYSTDKVVATKTECLKAIGLDRREFSGAHFQTRTLRRVRTEELLLRAVDLRKGNQKNSPDSLQWPLKRHNSPSCLTCAKIGVAKLKYPPKLYARNASSIGGAWASSQCRKEGRTFYSSRSDKFYGNTFESSFFSFDKPLCKKPMYELRTKGTIRKVSESVEVPGGVVYEITVQKAFVTALTVSMARILNINKGTCGKEAWDKGKTQDLVPTTGCSIIGYNLGPPELVLIRALRDENRNELYFGANMYHMQNKAGPVEYHYISESCSNFPVEITTPLPPVEITTTPVDPPTTEKDHPTEHKSTFTQPEEILLLVKPTSGGGRLNGLITSIFVFLVVCLELLRLGH